MRIISATPYLSKNTPFAVTCNECKSGLEMFSTDVFVDQHQMDEGMHLIPLFNCPVCKAMVEITVPAIPRRVLELWLADQPV